MKDNEYLKSASIRREKSTVLKGLKYQVLIIKLVEEHDAILYKNLATKIQKLITSIYKDSDDVTLLLSSEKSHAEVPDTTSWQEFKELK